MNKTKTRLINRAAVREKAMAVIATKRPALSTKFTRVSGRFYRKAQAAVENFIEDYIERMPSAGKTLT